MFVLFKIILESFVLALQELWANKLRTFLSILGITIGIFCVISVMMMVDSLEKNMRDGLSSLGDDIVFIDRFPWDGGHGRWWEYLKRPHPNYRDFKALQENSELAAATSIRIILRGQELKNQHESIENVQMAGISHDFGEVFDLDIEYGRYFTQQESDLGHNKVILGSELAANLFPYQSDPTGLKVRLQNRKMTVVGVIAKEGESILGDGYDEVALIPYNYARRYVNVNNRRVIPLITMKAKEEISLEELKDEVTGILRAQRKLRPKEENNFALNQSSILATFLDSIFAMVRGAGFIIGGFALLVGGFGIANIMFVSVRERTNLIGIKRSLGAKSYFILLEFLIEAILLCLIGGLVGIGLVYLIAFVGNLFIDGFTLVLTWETIRLGFIVSAIIGLLSGIIPAARAAALDPVEAIRHN